MNILDNILEQLSRIEKRLDEIERVVTHSGPSKVLLSEFCKNQKISRPTAHAWATKGIIQMEKIGSRNFVIVDGSTFRKYQRMT